MATKTLSENALYTKLHHTWHLHFCADPTCREVYECTYLQSKYVTTTSCDPRSNGLCQKCRGSISRPMRDVAPRACCIGNTALVTSRPELMLYRLAGPGPWYQCRTCCRPSGWPLGHNPERTHP